jgi:hypothetical protein
MSECQNNIYSFLGEAYDSQSSTIGTILYHYSLYEDNQTVKVLKGQRKNPQNPSVPQYESRNLNWDIDFKEDTTHLPLTIGDCSEDEEFLIFKAKKRPVIILGVKESLDVSKIPQGVQRNKANNAFRKSYLVAPIFSCSHGEKTTALGPFLTKEIKSMLHDSFLYLPPHPKKIITNHSVIRLDKIFWTNNLNYNPNSNYIHLSIPILNVIFFQIKSLFNLSGDNDSDIREMIDMLKQIHLEQI